MFTIYVLTFELISAKLVWGGTALGRVLSLAHSVKIGNLRLNYVI